MKFAKSVSTALLGAVLLTAGAASASDTKADWTTKLSVELALLNKLGTDSLQIDVDAEAGALKLTGTVDKRETRELAESVAKSVTGVTSVSNDIKLEASEQNPSKSSVAAGEAEAELKDALMATKIRIALADKMGSDGFKIGTEVANGVVTLAFPVEFTATRRTEARRMVDSVSGVTKVVSIDKK